MSFSFYKSTSPAFQVFKQIGGDSRWIARLKFCFTVFLFSCGTLYGQGYIDFSRYLGGNDDEYNINYRVVGNEVYVICQSSSNNIITTNGSVKTVDYQLVLFRLDAATGNILTASAFGSPGGYFDELLMEVYNGQVHVTGTISGGFPIVGGGINNPAGSNFYVKMDAITGDVLFSSRFNPGYSETHDIDVTDEGVFIYGLTNDVDYPVVGGGAPQYFGYDWVLSKFDINTGALVYSTYIGGNSEDNMTSDHYWERELCMVIENGVVHLTGYTSSTNFPVTNGTINNGSKDVAYMQRDANSGALLYSTYLGGAGDDYPMKIIVEGGALYLSGSTLSNNFPITSGQLYKNGSDIFLMKIDLASKATIFSILLGGNGNDLVDDMEISGGSVYLIGVSNSNNIPTTNGSGPSGNDLIYFRVDNSVGSIQASVYVGASNNGDTGERGLQISGGYVHILQDEASAAYPITNGTTNKGFLDLNYTKLALDGTLMFSTYFGGNDVDSEDYGGVREQDFIFNNYLQVATYTESSTYPVTVSTSTSAGFTQAAYTRLKICATDYTTTSTAVTPATQTTCQFGLATLLNAQPVTMTNIPVIYRNGQVSDPMGGEAKYQWQIADSPSGPWTNIPAGILEDYLPSVGGTSKYYRRLASVTPCCGGTVVSTTDVAAVLVNGNTAPTVNAGGLFNTCPSTAVTIGGSPTATGGTSPYTYVWDQGAAAVSNPSVSPLVTTIYTVTVTDALNCQQIDQAVVKTYSANAGADMGFCAGTTGVRIGTLPPPGVAGVTYSWTPTAGLDCATCAQPMASPTSATTYTVSMTLPITGGGTCTTTDNVDVRPVAAPPAGFAGADKMICLGQTAPLGTSAAGILQPLTAVTQTSVNTYTATVANLTDNNYTTGGRTALTYIPYTVVSQSTTNIAATSTNLTDNTYTTGGRTNSGSSQWIQIDLGSAQAVAAVQLAALNVNNLNGTYVQYSTDGITWNYGPVVSGVTTNSLTKFNLSSTSINARYLRVIRFATGIVDVSEFRVIAPQTITFDLGTIVPAVGSIQLAAIDPLNLNAMVLQKSTDGVTWSTAIFSISGTTNTSLTTLNFTSSSIRYLRVIGTVVDVSEVRILQAYSYTWAPGNYLTTNSSATTTFQPGSLEMPSANPMTYYVTAQLLGCTFVDEVQAGVIEARAGVDGCGPRYLGANDRTPDIMETYSWVKLSGPGTFTSATNIANPTVSASVGGSTYYQLTTSYTLNGASISCLDTVIVPDCGCVVNIFVNAPYSCPSFGLNGGSVTLEAAAATIISSNPDDFEYAWTVVSGPAGGLSSYVDRLVTLTDNISRTYRVTMSSSIDPSFSCFRDIVVNDPAWSLPVFMAQDETVCPGVSVQLGQPPVAGYSYLWSPPNGLTPGSTSSNPSVISGSNTASYSVLVTDIGSGCTSKDTATITVIPIVADAGPDWFVCDNGLVELGSSTTYPNVTYSWLPVVGTYQNGTNQYSQQPEFIAATNLTFTVTVTDLITGCTATDTAYVTVNNNPTITNFPDQTMCYGGAAIKLGAPALPGVTYTWSPSSGLSCTNCAQPYASPSSTTLYTVTAVFPGNCNTNATDMVNVTVNNPNFTMAGINYCPSTGAIPLGADAPTGMTTYQWSPESFVTIPTTRTTNSVNPPPSIPTTYTLTVRDVNGCTGSGTVTITPVQSAPIIASNQTICVGEPLAIGSASNPTGATITYSWSPVTYLDNPSSPNPIFTPTAAGTYTVTVTKTDSSIPCTSTARVTITVQGTTIPAMTSPSICQGACITIGTPTMAGVQYFWSPTAGLSDPFISNPEVCGLTETTTYTLTAIGANGCSSTANVVVGVAPQPAPNVVLDDQILCFQASTTLNATVTPTGSYNYQWSGVGLNNIYLQNPTANLPGTGNYVYAVTVTDLANGCTNVATATMAVAVCPKIACTVAAGVIGNDQTICAGQTPAAIMETTASTGDGTLTYQWQSSTTSCATGFADIAGAVTNIYSPPAITQTTFYRIVVTNTNSSLSCQDTTNCVQITVNPVPTVSASSNSPVCVDKTINLNASFTASGTSSSVTNWSWTGPNSFVATVEDPVGFTATTSSSGTYTVIATNNLGCTASATTTVTVNPLPTPSITGPTTVCYGGSITLNAGTGFSTYLWSNSGGSAQNATFSNIISNTTFTVTVSDANGCTGTATHTVSVVPAANAGADGNTAVCSNSTAPIDLFTIISGEQTGGTWTRLTGSGGMLSGNMFTPGAGVTTSTFQYIITGLSPCPNDTAIATINIKTTATGSVSYTGCQGDGYSVTVNGTVYNESNPTGTHVLTAANGCDSTVTIALVFNPNKTGSVSYIGCQGDGYSVTVNSTVYNESNPTGTQVLTAANGCDSTVTIALVFNPNKTGSVSYTGCQGDAYSVTVNGTVYNESNPTGTQVLTAANGCDSTVTIALVFNPNKTGSVSYTGCQGDGYSVTVNSTVYNESNPTGTQVLTAANGCDSTVTIALVFNPNKTGSVSYTGCQGDAYSVTVNGTIYNESNPTGTQVLTASNGCDSTVTITLVFNPNKTGSVSYTGCQGDGYSVTVNSTVYNESNPTGTQVLTAANGCDSTVTIALTFQTPVSAGIATNPPTICFANSGLSLLDLDNQISGASSGGAWSVVAGNPGGNFTASTGILDPNGLAIGSYTFRFTVPASGACPADFADVIVSINDCTLPCPPVICLPVKITRN